MIVLDSIEHIHCKSNTIYERICVDLNDNGHIGSISHLIFTGPYSVGTIGKTGECAVWISRQHTPFYRICPHQKHPSLVLFCTITVTFTSVSSVPLHLKFDIRMYLIHFKKI